MFCFYSIESFFIVEKSWSFSLIEHREQTFWDQCSFNFWWSSFDCCFANRITKTNRNSCFQKNFRQQKNLVSCLMFHVSNNWCIFLISRSFFLFLQNYSMLNSRSRRWISKLQNVSNEKISMLKQKKKCNFRHQCLITRMKFHDHFVFDIIFSFVVEIWNSWRRSSFV